MRPGVIVVLENVNLASMDAVQVQILARLTLQVLTVVIAVPRMVQ